MSTTSMVHLLRNLLTTGSTKLPMSIYTRIKLRGELDLKLQIMQELLIRMPLMAVSLSKLNFTSFLLKLIYVWA